MQAIYIYIVQVASLASLAQLLLPRSSACVIRRRTALCAELLLPDLRPLQLLHSDCVRSSPLASASSLQLLPDCVRFRCRSPIAIAAPQLCPLQLLLPDHVRFNCCSPIASASTAAPRLRPLQLLLPDRVHFDCCSLPSACSPSCSGRFQLDVESASSDNDHEAFP